MKRGIKNSLKSAAGLSALSIAAGWLALPAADAQCGGAYRNLTFADVTKTIRFDDRIVDNSGRPNIPIRVYITPDFESARRPIAIRGGDINRAPRNRNGGDSSDLTLRFSNNSVDNRFVTVDASFFVTRFDNPMGYLNAGFATPGVRIFTKGQDGGGGGAGGLFVDGQPGGRGGNGGDICTDFQNYRIFLNGTDTYGILAVSQGGLGGAGGGIELGLGASGGQAGGAGNGGDVELNLDNRTYVQASSAGVGVLAQSLGGAGGIGGGSSQGIGATGGGAAGAGGSGGDVRVTNRGTVLTDAAGGNGIVVQSIAGVGGAGGSAVGLFGILGGGGGGGGTAGIVSALNEGTVRTNGDGAFGFLLQSIGGGGGAGGNATGITAVGGGATSGGDAGERMTFTNRGLVLTRGDNASAIVLQSVGGGGGAGGNATGAIAVGGQAGSAGDGGTIGFALDTIAPTDGNQSRGIITQGLGSVGLLAQSIGGGGGVGGSSAGLGAIGGSGGAGGDGGRIEFFRDRSNRPGTIRTSGASSAGMVLQSIGGGGGHGGAAGAVAFSLGASGASGGDGGTILLDPSRGQLRGVLLDIETTGENSPGAIFQSIGGGGGNGGSATTTGLAAGVSIGGSGNEGGSGGLVDLFLGSNIGNTVPRIWTYGGNSVGVLGQSIGGGGGNGGSALTAIAGTGNTISVAIGGNGADGGVGGRAVITNFTNIATFGDNSGGILMQSIGGGGGNGGSSVAASGSVGDGFSANLALGGTGGDGGVAGTAAISNWRSVTTRGSNSHALTAQSIGGGGGNGGDALTFSAQASGSANLQLGLTVGGRGGSGGVGGSVNVDQIGGTSTVGDQSYAVLAQSIGGGGGSGGSAVSTSIGSAATGGALSLQLAVGGGGGSGGQAGSVRAYNRGGTYTAGDLSHAVVAQSIGGGGGSGGFAGTGAVVISARGGAGSALASIGGTGGSGGVAGRVTTIIEGPTRTLGNGANGVLAQSIGGGGGNGGVSLSVAASGNTAGSVSGNAGVAIGGDGAGGGISNNVDVFLRDTLETQGDNSAGIVAQSIGGGGGNGGFAARGALAVSLGSAPAASVGVSLGGQGANGGDGKLVRIIGDSGPGNIRTLGDNAIGALAQSIGGGGGNGGSAFTGGLSFSSGNSGNIGFSLGGEGGRGGNGGAIADRNVNFNRNFTGQTYGAVIDMRHDVTTFGDNSIGLLAQTVGGGGGNGGFALTGGLAVNGGNGVNLNASLGGRGGTGGDALTGAFIASRGLVTTWGDGATALLAQSIGGGGGNGGYSIAGGLSGGSNAAIGVNISLGGNAGTGGNAFGSHIDIFNHLTTAGNGAHGAHVQSLGGGGGNAGFAAALSGGQGGRSFSGAVALGRDGGTGGDSSEASINARNRGANGGASDLTITTRGDGSHALFAQSIGGGGGAASFGLASTIDVAGSTAFGVPYSVGGSGSSGGQGRRASIASNAFIVTGGDDSYGLFAQSIGGGGGAASQSISIALNATIRDLNPQSTGFSATIGGNDGGTGGRSGEANIINDGEVRTRGAGSIGLFGQSTGGGGGVGTFGAALAASFGGSGVIPTYAVALGGDGGTGGLSGNVDISNGGGVITLGDNAHALLGQSTGGGGGHGGLAIALSGTAGTTNLATSVSAALGGDGGSGGDADRVEVVNTGALSTVGNAASGLIAQSVGGGGGNAGYAVSGSVSGGAPNNNASLAFAMGGAGGSGGVGGSVNVESSGDITTVGGFSRGILAQSIGGGGGHAGAAYSGAVGFGKQVQAVSIALGGTGGNGGVGSTATVNNTARIITGATVAIETGGDYGDIGEDSAAAPARAQGGAVGILAQSIGGGGGAGGLAASLTGTIGTDTSTNFNLVLGSIAPPRTGGAAAGVGGRGGVGGAGSDVSVTNSGDITTVFEDSHGMHAQSVGGGGGSGGLSIAGAFGAQRSVNIALALGGEGAEGGDAGQVRLVNNGGVDTFGAQSHGLFAQSIGGGGGYAGTTGAMSFGATQSSNLSLTLGASGGAGGAGGRIDLVGNGAIETRGEGSHALVAQSIGGGGGMGGIAGLYEGLFADLGLGGVNPSSAGGAGQRTRSLSLAFGGRGGSGAAGGSVFVIQSEDIITHGANAYGMLAQSIGGGGGAGGISTAAGAEAGTTDGSVSLNVAMGGNGGSGAHAGFVQLTNRADVTTFGDGATGIVVQSIGGGGGYGAAARGEFLSFTNPVSTPSSFQSGVALGGQGGVAGDGGTARAFKDEGRIATFGHSAHGILAQSVGGGGGVGGQAAIEGVNLASLVGQTGIPSSLDVAVGGTGGASGNGGAVWVRLAEGGTTLGTQSSVIYAQSIGGGGGAGGAASAGSTGAMITGGEGSEGDGGSVLIGHSAGMLFTTGVRSHGIFAQSIGGGGGEATDVLVSGSAVTAGSLTNLMETAADAANSPEDARAAILNAANGYLDGLVPDRTIELTLGGTASTGNGGLVDVDSAGDIQLSGAGSYGVFAQSIGGGGGVAGSGLLGLVDQIAISPGLELLGLSEAGADLITMDRTRGDGGVVDVKRTGLILASGVGSMGIVAQSVGGGGGFAGNFPLGILDYGAAARAANPARESGNGDGGAVSVATSGDIVLTGHGSIGILAQSIGGAGGVISRAQGLASFGSLYGAGQAGAVTVNSTGDIDVRGLNGVGIFAQSDGRDGDGDITILSRGTVLGGAGFGASVIVDGGGSNEIRFRRALDDDYVWAASGDILISLSGSNLLVNENRIFGDVTFGGGRDRVDNRNQFFGALNLGAGNNLLTNREDAVFVGTISGAGADIKNLGLLLADISLGSRDDTITNAEGATLSGSSDFGAGNDSLVNNGTLTGAYDFGPGNDTFNNRGMADVALNMGNGTNVIANREDAVMIAAVTGGVNRDRLFNFGVLQGSVDLGAGGDAFNNYGWSELSTLSLGRGDNTVFNSEDGVLLASIFGDDGDDTFTNEGRFEGRIVLGSGQNRIINEGLIIVASPQSTSAAGTSSTSTIADPPPGLTEPVSASESYESRDAVSAGFVVATVSPSAPRAGRPVRTPDQAVPGHAMTPVTVHAESAPVAMPLDQGAAWAVSTPARSTVAPFTSDATEPGQKPVIRDAAAAPGVTGREAAPNFVRADQGAYIFTAEFERAVAEVSVLQNSADRLSTVWTADVENDGLISLAGGGVGDRLVIEGSLSGDGAFVLDAAADSGVLISADSVLVRGDATGSTVIGLNIDLDAPLQSPGELRLFEVQGDSTAAEFFLASSDAQQGAFGLDLALEGGLLTLQAQLLDQVVLYNSALTSQQLSWQAGADVIGRRLRRGGDAPSSQFERELGDGRSAWFNAYASQGEAAPEASQFQSNYDFERHGFAAGFELEDTDGVRLGAFVGANFNRIDLAARNGRNEVDSVTFGGYGALNHGRAHASILFKADVFDAQFIAPDLTLSEDTKGRTLGLQAAAGYRLDLPEGWELHPRVEARVSNTGMDGFTDAYGVVVSSRRYEVATLGAGASLYAPEISGIRPWVDLFAGERSSPGPEAWIDASGTHVTSSLEGELIDWTVGLRTVGADRFSVSATISGRHSDHSNDVRVGIDASIALN